jgi:hypothetical protein
VYSYIRRQKLTCAVGEDEEFLAVSKNALHFAIAVLLL